MHSPAADGQQMVKILCHGLKAVATDQAATISDACHSNATAIAQTVAELEKMNVAVDEVKTALLEANQSMQVSPGVHLGLDFTTPNCLIIQVHNLGSVHQ